ncbi:MAG TPA: peroxiredoxin [Polyangiaceae bacterium]|nr:peroxiredoxin [Polyangiaceae bacterium]
MVRSRRIASRRTLAYFELAYFELAYFGLAYFGLAYFGLGLLPVPQDSTDSLAMALKVGDPAPDFEVTARQQGRDRVLSLQGVLAERFLVLYFYPRDFTLVCTREACGFRDSYDELRSAGAEVVGVSVDDPVTHDRFARERGVTFPLVSDPQRKLAVRYGATSVLSSVMGISARMTFVIERSGGIVAIFDSAFRASEHVDGARAAIRALKS